MSAHTMEWVVDTLYSAGTGGLLENGLNESAPLVWSGAVVDSRADCAGRMFFAMRGENTDGHRYVEAAHNAGAVCAIVDDSSVCPRLRDAGIPYLLVSDCRGALQALAREYRNTLDARVVAITGSAGKTTTKEYVRRILASRFRVFANPGNFNSNIGVPLSVLEADADSEYLVCEVGANQAGEIGHLAGILRPDVGVITNVGDAHVGMFGSVDAIADAKSELLGQIAPRGYAVLPRDDAYFEAFASRTKERVRTFGRSPEADFVVSHVRQEGARIRFAVNGEEIDMNAVGGYNALNACAAFAVGDLCGIEHRAIAGALAETRQMRGRGMVHTSPAFTVIDESYNASPASMHESLGMLEAIDAKRKIAVLGDMKELGDYSEDRHRRLGERLATAGVDVIYWLGDEGKHVREGFESAGGGEQLRLYKSLEEMVEDVVAGLKKGDALLVKASRAQNLDRVVDRLLQTLGPETEN